MDGNKFLAKGDGETLIDHSKLVSNFAVAIAEISGNKNYFDDWEEYLQILNFAGLLHDIAKSTDENQKALKGGTKLPEKKFTHNEIGWAFVSKHLKMPKRWVKEEILYLIYWHHGIKSNLSQDKNETIYLSNIKEKDISNQLEYLKIIIDPIFISKSELNEEYKSPLFFENNDKDIFRIFLRSCLISADRLVSGLTKEQIENFIGNSDKIKEFVENLTNRKELIQISQNPYNNERFFIQESISKSDDQTIIINAPGGFGKTLIPILYGIRNKKKIIYVAPRNTIAESIYKNVIEELNNFGISDVSVQLYLTGKVQDSFKNNLNRAFETDIIVTNIDNFLKPTVDNKNAGKLYYLLNCTVVFDEYHEFVSDGNALFKAFINIMKMRHCLTDSKTFLLSATPYVGLEEEWDNFYKKSVYFPSRDSFYPAAHDKPYKFNIVEYSDNEEEFKEIEDCQDALIVTNSISKSQEYVLKNNNNFLIHSQFEKDIKQNKLNNLFQTHGKNILRDRNTTNVVATSIVQASLNISFTSLHESCISPSSTVQRVARINRFGELDNACSVFVYNSKSREEMTARTNFFDREISNLWFDYLLVELNTSIKNLDNLYEHYVNFHNKFQKQIKSFLKSSKNESENWLKTIYPDKIDKEEQDPDIEEKNKKLKNKKAGSNKIRSSNNEVFFICRRYNENWEKLDTFTDVFSTKYYRSPEEDFDDLLINTREYDKRIRLVESDERFDYTRLLNKKGKYKISDTCKDSVTPYIRMDVVHHPYHGVIKKKLLQKNNINI